MASGDTKTEALLNILGNGGSADEYRGCCNTKTQNYIIDAIDRINSIPGATDFTGATDTTDGTHGLVPAPVAGDNTKFLKGDGTWAEVSGGTGGAITGEGAPTLSTEAEEGQTYLDTTTGKYYVCFKVEDGNYFWTEIETDEPISNYGQVDYYSRTVASFDTEWADNCTINSVDAATMEAFLEAHPTWDDRVNFDYQEAWDPETGEPIIDPETGEPMYFWMFWGEEGEVIIYPDEMLATTGVDVSIDDPEMPWAMFSLIYSEVADTSSEILSVDILGKSQFDSLAGDGNYIWTCTLGNPGVEVKNKAIKAVWLNPSFNDLVFPDYFLSYCSSLDTVRKEVPSDNTGVSLYAGGKMTIGDSCFVGCTGIQDFYLTGSGDVVIGYNFLQNSGNGAIGSHAQIAHYNAAHVLEIGDYCLQEGHFRRVELFACNKLGDGFCSYSEELNELRLENLRLSKIGNQFANGCPALTAVYMASNNNIKEVGNDFLSGTTSLYECGHLNGLSHVTSVGDNFMMDSNVGPSSAGFLPTFWNKLSSVGYNFMCRCGGLNGSDAVFDKLMDITGGAFLYRTNINSVRLPSCSLPKSSTAFLATDDPNSRQYVDGVTVYVQNTTAWANQYPNSDSDPYRKLTFLPAGSADNTTYAFSNTDDGWEVVGSDGYSFSHTDMGGGGGTTDFNQLSNRPMYNGSTMDGNTNIPEVKTYTAGANIQIDANNAISATDTTYTAGNGLTLNGTEFSVNSIANGGTTAPTTSTVGTVGKLYTYVDTTGATPEPHIMICTAVTESGGVTTYTWTDLLGGIASQLNIINNGGNS